MGTKPQFLQTVFWQEPSRASPVRRAQVLVKDETGAKGLPVNVSVLTSDVHVDALRDMPR